MTIVRFRNNREHEELLKKVKKMKKFTEELEECLEEAIEEDDFDYRDNEEYDGGMYSRGGGRYAYRRGGGRGY